MCVVCMFASIEIKAIVKVSNMGFLNVISLIGVFRFLVFISEGSQLINEVFGWNVFGLKFFT